MPNMEISLLLSEVVKATLIKELPIGTKYKMQIFETENGIKFSNLMVIGVVWQKSSGKKKEKDEDGTSTEKKTSVQFMVSDGDGNEIWCQPSFDNEEVARVIEETSAEALTHSTVRIHGQLREFKKKDDSIGRSISITSMQILDDLYTNEAMKLEFAKMLKHRKGLLMPTASQIYQTVVEPESIPHTIKEDMFYIGSDAPIATKSIPVEKSDDIDAEEVEKEVEEASEDVDTEEEKPQEVEVTKRSVPRESKETMIAEYKKLSGKSDDDIDLEINDLIADMGDAIDEKGAILLLLKQLKKQKTAETATEKPKKASTSSDFHPSELGGQIVDLLKDGSKLLPSEIASTLKVTSKDVLKAIKELIDHKLIAAILNKDDGKQYYKIVG